MNDDQTTFEAWAIVDLFGHSQIAGQVSEQQIAGGTFLRVDVPAGDDQGFTRYYGAGAIYSITPVPEDVARKAAASLQARPITVWGITPTSHQIEYHDDDLDDEQEVEF